MQCSNENTHSSKCMILLECLTHHLLSESSPTPSHSPKPRMRISIFVCLWTTLRCIYIYQLGRLRRLIYYMWTTLQCISIGLSPTIDIFSLDYPPIIYISRQPSEPFFSKLISCTHSYSPRVFQCIWNACMPFPIQSKSHANI